MLAPDDEVTGLCPVRSCNRRAGADVLVFRTGGGAPEEWDLRLCPTHQAAFLLRQVPYLQFAFALKAE